jgi:hypothetical protein
MSGPDVGAWGLYLRLCPPVDLLLQLAPYRSIAFRTTNGTTPTTGRLCPHLADDRTFASDALMSTAPQGHRTYAPLRHFAQIDVRR